MASGSPGIAIAVAPPGLDHLLDNRREPLPPIHRAALQQPGRVSSNCSVNDPLLDGLEVSPVTAVQETFDRAIRWEAVGVLAVGQERGQSFLVAETLLAVSASFDDDKTGDMGLVSDIDPGHQRPDLVFGRWDKQ